LDLVIASGPQYVAVKVWEIMQTYGFESGAFQHGYYDRYNVPGAPPIAQPRGWTSHDAVDFKRRANVQ
jgi:hypothetical protein